MTEDGHGYNYTYDALGRLTRVWTGTKTIAQYRYKGLNHRIAWRYDTNNTGEVDSGDPWYYFCYDDRWRVVATFRADDEHPKEVFVHHAAGVGGFGGSSYIDSVIFRDRDVKAKWIDEAEEAREERLYYVQNWRADVSAILTDAGSLVEWVKYSTYGVPYALPAGDTDSDGDWDAADSAKIAGWSAGYDVRADANLDGVINGADITHANSITGGYQALGRGVLSSHAVNNRRGYAGYEYDPTLEGAGRWLYHVRHRVYDAEVGRWTRRDPLGYIDGLSLYQYARGMAVVAVDPMGLQTAIGSTTCGGGLPCYTARSARRAEAFRNYTNCMAGAAVPIGIPAVICIVVCSISTGGLGAPACIALCVFATATYPTANHVKYCGRSLDSALRQADDNYCFCLALQQAYCPNNAEPDVVGCTTPILLPTPGGGSGPGGIRRGRDPLPPVRTW